MNTLDLYFEMNNFKHEMLNNIEKGEESSHKTITELTNPKFTNLFKIKKLKNQKRL